MSGNFAYGFGIYRESSLGGGGDGGKLRDLFDSMYKGFPVGYFRFSANGLPMVRGRSALTRSRKCLGYLLWTDSSG